MNPNLEPLAERVWERTRPALRRRRLVRRATGGSIAVVAIALLALVSLPEPRSEPASPSLAAPAAPELPAPSDYSLAVLIIDSSGVRFAQLRSDEITSHGLSPNFTLDPVITSPLAEFY